MKHIGYASAIISDASAIILCAFSSICRRVVGVDECCLTSVAQTGSADRDIDIPCIYHMHDYAASVLITMIRYANMDTGIRQSGSAIDSTTADC